MRFFSIDRLTSSDPKYYFVEKRPKGLGLNTWQMSVGERAAEFWPAEPPRVYPSESNAGLKLPSLIGTTHGYLIVCSSVRAVIEELCQGCDIEYLPIALYNHKNRQQSSDYCFVNPVGRLDCLDQARSKIVYTDKHEVVSVDKIVLDPARIKDAPPLFRIKEDPRVYVISEALARAFAGHNFTNLGFFELEVAPEQDKQ